jgi:hypothetical protein
MIEFIGENSEMKMFRLDHSDEEENDEFECDYPFSCNVPDCSH